MTEKKPKEMGLGEIVRELNLLASVKVLTMVTSEERAYTIAPSYCKTPENLARREDILCSELNSRGDAYMRNNFYK